MRIKKTLNKAELKKFKTIFEKKKEELVLHLAKSQSEVDVDGDEVDLIQGSILTGVTSALSKRDLNTVARLDIALEKIDKGTFGLCETCDELIGQKRLLAILGCTNCISCAIEDELEQKQFS